MFALRLDFLAFTSIEGKSSKKPSIELKRQTDQETLWKFPLCVISHVDQQSSRIGRKMSHVYCIVRTQDSYVLQEARLFGSPSRKISIFLATNWRWRSANAIRTIGVDKRTEDMWPSGQPAYICYYRVLMEAWFFGCIVSFVVCNLSRYFNRDRVPSTIFSCRQIQIRQNISLEPLKIFMH